MFAGATVPPGDTILVPAYGILKTAKKRKTQVFVLRSTNGGNSFTQHAIPGNASNESTIVWHPSGVAVVIIRSVAGPIFVSRSLNRGKTWFAPISAGFEGSPLHALCLRSGTIACAYADRWKTVRSEPRPVPTPVRHGESTVRKSYIAIYRNRRRS